MRQIILTIDYELFLGWETGSVKECMIEPTEKLLSILEKNGSKMTVFWDILHYYRLIELEKKYPELSTDKHLIEDQILELARRGHDIQQHLHPHWLDTFYKDGRWYPDYRRFKLHNLSTDDNREDINSIAGCITISKNIMQTLVRKTVPDYEVTSFRAGGYLIEPYKKLKDAFLKNGIRVDSSVCPGLYNDNDIFAYDFRNYPAELKYNFEDSPQVKKENGSFIEIPVTTVRIPVVMNLFFALIRRLKYPDIESERKGSGSGEYTQSNGNRNYKRLSNILRPRINQLTTDSSFKEMFNYILSKVTDNSTMIIHPKLLNKHTFEVLENLLKKNLVKFIPIREFIK